MERVKVFLVLFFAVSVCAPAQQPEPLGALPEVALEKLSDRSFTALAMRALGVRAGEWRHAETEHFVYHFFDAPTAAAVSVEAEFAYRVIAQELGRDTALWERKCHLFLFNEAADWKLFQNARALEPWTGGIHSQGTLFALRATGWRAKNQTLPHEITHLVLERFFGAGIPLWLNEGFAEYAGSRCRAAFYRARGYNEKPRAAAVTAERYLPVAQLTAMAAYPAEDAMVPAFYDESEKLVRFLCAADKKAFLAFLDAMAKGARFESALGKAFGARFASVEALDKEFRAYAVSQFVPGAR